MPAPRMTTSKVSAVASVMKEILLLRRVAKTPEPWPERLHRLGEIEEYPVLLVIGALPAGVRLIGGLDRCQVTRIVGGRGEKARSGTGAQGRAPGGGLFGPRRGDRQAEDIGEETGHGGIARDAARKAGGGRREPVAQRIDMDAMVEGDPFQHRAHQIAPVVPGIEAVEAGARRAAEGR